MKITYHWVLMLLLILAMIVFLYEVLNRFTFSQEATRLFRQIANDFSDASRELGHLAQRVNNLEAKKISLFFSVIADCFHLAGECRRKSTFVKHFKKSAHFFGLVSEAFKKQKKVAVSKHMESAARSLKFCTTNIFQREHQFFKTVQESLEELEKSLRNSCEDLTAPRWNAFRLKLQSIADHCVNLNVQLHLASCN